ncbi:MAG TPA: sigma 54-interacting transcriptional regulator [Polyangiaceae bacterium]|nr:sigma 54-interacting transcriptional regulator [Polyangiaceae bacterium]
MTRVRLEVRAGGATRTVEPDGDVVRIGRSPASEISVEDRRIARHHASVLVKDDSATLEDAGSGYATAVLRGEARLVLGEKEPRTELLQGDVIALGDGGESGDAVLIGVFLDADLEPPRFVETRPLSVLPASAASAPRPDALLKTLGEVQRKVGAAEDLGGVLAAVADAVLELVPRATHATVVLRDDARPAEDAFVPMLTRVRGAGGKGASPPEPVRVARSVFRKVVRERAAVLAADAVSGELSSESMLGASIKSTIGVPLWRGEEILGVLQLDNRAAPAMFGAADVDVALVLAANASLAVSNARLIERLSHAEERLERENRFLKGRERARRGTEGEIVGKSAATAELLRQIAKVADTRVSVLIEGETGSGKELVASSLHYGSRRRERLFVAQNCAALPENLLESELFGHKRGAFTGATDDRKGLFEVADGGTLFLDEVTEMPLSLQAKLLRVLQEGEVRPVGATATKSVDVRIVAATNRNLEKEVAEGRFREDLYYRLKVFPLRVPPLRERREDVALLAAHFLSRYSAEMGKPVQGFSQTATELLAAYDWPGNVRELENEVQRLVIQAEPNGFVTDDLLSPKVRKVESSVASAGVAKGTLKEMMDQVERHFVAEALRLHGNNKTTAAKALGITREGLHKKLRQLGMS